MRRQTTLVYKIRNSRSYFKAIHKLDEDGNGWACLVASMPQVSFPMASHCLLLSYSAPITIALARRLTLLSLSKNLCRAHRFFSSFIFLLTNVIQPFASYGLRVFASMILVITTQGVWWLQVKSTHPKKLVQNSWARFVVHICVIYWCSLCCLASCLCDCVTTQFLDWFESHFAPLQSAFTSQRGIQKTSSQCEMNFWPLRAFPFTF